MEVVLQIESRAQQDILRAHIGSGGMVIGRGWDCDVILRDTRVDPQHCRLRLNGDGQLEVQDLGSVNGTSSSGRPLQEQPVVLVSGDTLTVGRTQIQIYDIKHPVPAARSPSIWDTTRDVLGDPKWATLITVFSAAIILGFEFLETTTEYKSERFVRAAIATGTAGLTWTIFWSVVAKLIRGEAHIVSNWSLGLLSLAATALFDDVREWLAFNLQSITTAQALEAGFSFLLLAVPLLIALAFSTLLRRRTRWLLAFTPALTVLFVTNILPMFNDDKPVNSPPTLLTSRPPALQWGSPMSIDTFIDNNQSLYQQTQQDALRRQLEDDK